MADLERRARVDHANWVVGGQQHARAAGLEGLASHVAGVCPFCSGVGGGCDSCCASLEQRLVMAERLRDSYKQSVENQRQTIAEMQERARQANDEIERLRRRVTELEQRLGWSLTDYLGVGRRGRSA